MADLIYRDTARRIISSPRTQKQMLMVLDTALPVDAIPASEVKAAIAEINEEKDFAYADFEQYKVDILGVDPEYVEDELPYDEFRYGMERCLDIIRKHTKVGDTDG